MKNTSFKIAERTFRNVGKLDNKPYMRFRINPPTLILGGISMQARIYEQNYVNRYWHVTGMWCSILPEQEALGLGMQETFR